MRVNIVSKQVPVTDAIRSYAEKKMPRIKKFFADPIDVTITLSIQKNEQAVEVLVNSKGTYLKGIEKSEDIYSAIDLAVDKIEKQVARYKDKLKDRKYEEKTDNPLKMNIYDASSIDDSVPKIIVSKEISAKPMSVEEAVMQMDLLNKPFFVFRNDEDSTVNIVYKRDDGQIGLILP